MEMEPLESQVKVMKPKCKLIGENGSFIETLEIILEYVEIQ